MLVCSRHRQRFKWFMHGAGVPDHIWPHPEPKEGTVAYQLLSGVADESDPQDVPADAWFKRKDAWWFRVCEHSISVGNGEVLSLISWPDDTQLRATFTPVGTWLPWQPGKGARARWLQCLRTEWGYRRRRGEPGQAVLETEIPSRQQLVVPPIEKLDAEGFRRLVDEVARHKGVPRGAILWSMLKRPKE